MAALVIMAACNGVNDASLDSAKLGKPDAVVTPGRSIQAAMDAAEPGGRIFIAPGVYREAVVINKPGIKLIGLGRRYGSQGKAAATLENPGGEENGITVTPNGDGVEIVNLVIRNFEENGIFLSRVDGFLISEVVAENNGEYGFYPVTSTNGLIEKCTASGHSDAGVYVGRRSRDIVIQGCVAFENVTGFEITNSSFIEATNNEAFNNSAGFLVALLPAFPNAPSPSVTNIVLTGNHVYDNNLPNFAYHGLEQYTPTGSGMLILGINDSIVEHNTVTGNGLFGIGLGNTGILAELAEVELGDIEPFPDGVRVVNNVVTGNGGSPPGEDDFLPIIARVDLLWDGTGTDNCWSGNEFGTSLNLDLFGGSPSFELPECDAP